MIILPFDCSQVYISVAFSYYVFGCVYANVCVLTPVCECRCVPVRRPAVDSGYPPSVALPPWFLSLTQGLPDLAILAEQQAAGVLACLPALRLQAHAHAFS